MRVLLYHDYLLIDYICDCRGTGRQVICSYNMTEIIKDLFRINRYTYWEQKNDGTISKKSLNRNTRPSRVS